MTGCDAFRTRLERELAGQVGSHDVRALAWHEHLLGCGACRELLEAEQALEELLASLPTPQLSPRVARRVLARLRELRAAEHVRDPVRDPVHNEARLDALLELDVAAPPGDLARNVLAGLRGERAGAPRSVPHGVTGAVDPERALDRLLDLDAATPPADLARRVLAGLAAHRSRERVPGPVVARAFARRLAGWALPIAAGVLVALGGWALWPAGDDRAEADTRIASVTPDPELLAALDVLEEWDLLMDMEQDLDLLFSTLEPADELLLEYQDEPGGGGSAPSPAREPETAPRALPPRPDPTPDSTSGKGRDARG